MTHSFRVCRAALLQAAMAGLLLLSIASAIAAPARPNLLYANPTSANVTLNWDAVAGAASYNLYMANASGVTPTSSGLPGFMAHTGITGTSFTHPSALVNGTTYYFILTAVNGTGESSPSPETSSTPSAAVDAAKAGVAAAFAQYASVVNTQGMNLSYTHVLGLYATGFLINGWDATVDAKRFASDLRGSTLGGWVLRGVIFYDEVNQIISVTGTIMVNGVPQELNGSGGDGFPVLKSSDNGVTWKTYGNQRVAKTEFQVEMRTDRGPNSNTGPRQSVNFDTEAPINTVTSISVSGPGIASSLALNPSTIRIETVVGDPAQPAGETFSSNAFGTNFGPSVVVQSGSAYTFSVTRSMSAGGGTFVYTVPFVGTAVTDPVNGAIDITSPIGHTLAEATLGVPLPVTWTLPTAYTISEVTLGGHVSTSTMPGAGFSCQIDLPSLPATTTSANFTFPATCNSLPVVATSINLASVGTKGERSIILYDFSGGVSVPSAPAIGAATAGNTQATVSFSPSANNGGSTITGYTVTASPGGATANGVTSPITVTGLINGASYTFTVRATNAVGNSPESLPSNSVTPVAVPGTFIVTPSAGANGTISPNTAQTVASGATIMFTITANSGYTANVATGAGTCGGTLTGTAPNYSYTTNPVTANCTVITSFTAPATIPDAPTIGTTLAGDGQATISFTPPVNDGGSVILSYTAICNAGGYVATGAMSPLTVTGLANGTTYACSVSATNSVGTSNPSLTVSVTPQPTPAFTAVQSRKTHGTAGTFDLLIDHTKPINGAVTVEPRFSGAGHKIVFQFPGPIASVGTATVVDANLTVIGMAYAATTGNEVIVTLTGVPDKQRATVTVRDINGTGTVSVSLGILVGDVTSSRSVKSNDISGIKARLTQTADLVNFRFDINASGIINQADVTAAKARSGSVLP